MDRHELREKVVDIMKDVFDRDDIEPTETTSAEDIEEWDSLSHVRLMISVEKAFKIKFRNEEIAEMKNLGDLLTSIQAKLPGNS
jgi:acyl carrier protein